ncbi:MAG: hypothetical protein WAK42_23225, partial [Mycobacterium sp.]
MKAVLPHDFYRGVEYLTAPGTGAGGTDGLLDGQGLIVSEIGGYAKPLDTEILGDDGLHDLRRSAVDRL